MTSFDPLDLCKALIRCQSVTPTNAGVLETVVNALTPLGFTCELHTFGEDSPAPVMNLYARIGSKGPNLCFAGHTDVVPVGDLSAWKVDPFAGTVLDDVFYGRGAVDMKGAIGCFISAVSRFIAHQKELPGSISFLITNDEEGPATYGTKPMLELLAKKGERLDACIVGEPTNPERLGEMIKIGRRGSVSFHLKIEGTQGHVAYPHLADNPITPLIHILHQLKSHTLDSGTTYFPPSNLEITTIDVGNPTGNIIPRTAEARFNIRFNDQHDAKSLTAWVKSLCEATGKTYSLGVTGICDVFLTKEGRLSECMARAVEETSKTTPTLSTTGGTSDARFIKDYCPVIEYGLINRTAHKVDESIAVADLYTLTSTYERFLCHFFGVR